MLRKTNENIPVVLKDKYDGFRDVLKAGDDNAITVGVLDLHLDFIAPEWRYAANLISESYTLRYMKVMNGSLIKHIPCLAHFDYLCKDNLYYDCFYPVLYQSILRFLKEENGGYNTKNIVCRISALKNDEYFQVFMSILKQSIIFMQVF